MATTIASSRCIYTVVGALFGVLFPLVAVLLRIWQHGLSQIAIVIKNDPLLWIIFSATIFSWRGGYIAGIYQDRAVQAQYQAAQICLQLCAVWGEEDVRAGESAVQNIHDALERIIHQARRVSEMVAGIAAASEQQSSAMNDNGLGIHKIIEVAQHSPSVIK